MVEADRLPERDANGYVWHPDIPEPPTDDEEAELAPAIEALGFDVASVFFSDDASVDASSPDASAWLPTPPIGDGWQLIAIFDTEDMPVATFVRAHHEN